MNRLFLLIVSLSISGSILILALLFFKLLFKNKLSQTWQYYIWLVVIARLLFPFTPEQSVTESLFQNMQLRFSVHETQKPEGQAAPGLTGPTVAESGEPSKNPDYEKNTTGQKEQTLPGAAAPAGLIAFFWAAAKPYLGLLWLAAALMMLVRKITLYQSFVRYIKAGWTELRDMERLELFGRLCEESGVQTTVRIYTNPLISSPLLIGFFRPCIILPEAAVSDSGFTCTVLHELTHCRRHDMFYKWAAQFTLCLHWFNPLVCLMVREINRSCELACDEAVISKLDGTMRRSYGDNLLNAASAGGNYRDSLASLPLQEGKKLLKERLGAIMKCHERSKTGTVLTCALTAVLIAGAVKTGAYASAVLPESVQNTDKTYEKANVSGALNNTSVSLVDAFGNLMDTPEDLKSASGNTSSSGKSFIYTQNGYYEAPYLFELGWNLNEEGIRAYPAKADIKLSDDTMISVSFAESCSAYSRDEAALTALKPLLEQLRTQYKNSSLSLTHPLVISAENIGGKDLNKLAEEYYTNEKLTRFTAIFPALDDNIKKAYCDRMFKDSQLAFFASVIYDMDSEIIKDYAERAYREDSIAFFAVLVPELSAEERSSLAARASADKKITFLSVLTEDEKTEENWEEKWEDIWKDDWEDSWDTDDFSSGTSADNTYNFPVSFGTLAEDHEEQLGRVPNLRDAKGIQYELQAGSGDGTLIVCLKKAENIGEPIKYYYVSSSKGTISFKNKDDILYDKNYTGEYNICIWSQDGSLSNVTGNVKITY